MSGTSSSAEKGEVASLKELQSSIAVLLNYCDEWVQSVFCVHDVLYSFFLLINVWWLYSFILISKRHKLDIPEAIRKEVSESLRSSHGASFLATPGSTDGGRRTKRTKSEDLLDLHSSVASHVTYLNEQKALRGTSKEGDLVNVFTAWKQAVRSQLPELDLRVQDGKFTVMNYFEQDPNEEKQQQRQDNNNNDDSGGGERRYAKQNIQTVKTTNICYQLYYLLKRCIRSKGHFGKYSVEKTIIDQVNLYFEPGKMYLVM